MSKSITLTLSGDSSVLTAQYFPPIELGKKYELGLLEFYTYNSIPNINNSNNRLIIDDDLITIPIGCYETQDIIDYIKSVLPEYIKLDITINERTLRCEIKCSHWISFYLDSSVGGVLGFQNQVLEPKVKHVGRTIVKIFKVNGIRVECNITSGAYVNSQSQHTIHQFYPNVPSGYKIVEVPNHVIYMPVTVQSIHDIQLRIVDQDGDLVDFQEEVITVRLHLRPM